MSTTTFFSFSCMDLVSDRESETRVEDSDAIVGVEGG